MGGSKVATVLSNIMAASIAGTCRHGSVEELLDSFHLAAEEAKLSDYFGCFSPDGYFLGTDATEHWDVSHFYEYSKPHFDAGVAWTYRPIEGSRKVHYFPSKETPAFCTFDESLDSEVFSMGRGTGSMVYNKSKSSWFILSYHLSFPIPNEFAPYVCKAISVYEEGSKSTRVEAAAAQAAQELLAELELESEKESTSTPSVTNKKKNKKKKK